MKTTLRFLFSPSYWSRIWRPCSGYRGGEPGAEVGQCLAGVGGRDSVRAELGRSRDAVQERRDQAGMDEGGSVGARAAGRLKSKTATFTRSFAHGAQDGEYVVIQFDTRFENKAAAVETITPMRQRNGAWKVSGFLHPIGPNP